MDDLFLILILFIGVNVVVFWFAMVIWAYRDMRARSRDPLARVLAAILVALLNLPGLFIYVLLRPRESLSEAYERSLEEEALLQEIEEKPGCPGCGQRTQHDWQACPYCHTRLKKTCVDCAYLLELSWNICPSCTASQINYASDGKIATDSRHVKPAEPPPIEPPSPNAEQQLEWDDAARFDEREDYRP